MSGVVSTRWYFPDWLSDPGVRACSLAAKGFWMDCLCLMAANDGREHGFLLIAGRKPTPAALARQVGSSPDEIESVMTEVIQNRVCGVDRRGVLYSRRMVRAAKYRGNGRHETPRKSLPDSVNKKAPPTPIPVPVPKKESKRQTPPTAAVPAWPPDFREQFWRLYPRHTEKKAALEKLDGIRRAGSVDFTKLITGVERLRSHVAVHRTEQRYIKHPTTWLNRGCWDDELSSDPPNGGPNGTHRHRGAPGGFAHNVADFFLNGSSGDASGLGSEEPAGLIQEIH